MAKHDQRPDKSVMVCVNCKKGNCSNCVDVPRAIYTDDMICKCQRKDHMGEPNRQQILDPDSGSIYGPHSVIDKDGNVVSDEDFKKMWREQFGDQ